MSSTQYCPVCSAYLKDPNLKICPKCGADILSERKYKERREQKIMRESQLVQGPFHPVTGKQCPICGEDVEIMSESVEDILVRGEVFGQGPMGGERALYRAIIGYRPWRCRKGHLLFSSYEVVWKHTCPRCRGPMSRYGDLVYTCPPCKLMIQADHFLKEDPVELMKKKGYHYAPDLEKKAYKAPG